MTLVLDASVALAWGFPDEVTPYSQSVLVMANEGGATVSAVWPLEIANALVLGERRQRLQPSETAEFIELLESLPIRVEVGTCRTC
jgi:predicted nucleic acid-binding protein